MNRTLNKYSGNIGNFILVTGVLHLIIGFVENWSVAIDILQSGIINTVDETPERFGFFWFEMNGLFVLLVGSFIQQYLNEYRKPIPRRYGYYLLIIAIIGCLLEPVSGFYVFIIISLPIIFCGNKNFITGDTMKSKEVSKNSSDTK
ncbi:DUF6463 family protein [Parapedobacter tibetensis]|uniref:DUF6463 family protein n=1 Tax=Parapedobacter tibetensis TaxID=2972951 RepID=UPI00214DDBDD|nr:DUF6463 family protein [Parapedobacter tibetensis]